MQFCVIAHDRVGEDVLDCRRKALAPHIANADAMIEEGHLICGGPILNAMGEACGSVLILDFNTREELEEYIKREPFNALNAWGNISVETIRVTKISEKNARQNK